MTQDAETLSPLEAQFAQGAELAPSLLHAPHASRARSIAKAVSWRLFGSLDTFLIAWVVTGQAHLGAAISCAEVCTKLALYYLHERGWAHIRWGVKADPRD